MFQLVFYENHDYQRALKIYSALEGQNGWIQDRLGSIYENTGNKDKAIEFYNKAMLGGNQHARERYEILTKPKVIAMPTPERVTPTPHENITTERNNITFPTAGSILGTKVNMRISPNRSARVSKQLNSGHPVSVAMLRKNNGENWYLVKTASGSEGWIYGDFLSPFR